MPRQDDYRVSVKRSNLFLYLLVFVLLLVFSIHNFDSIGQDIGRHLKIGEIIWQTKEVPKTNLFSFTEPNFLFINHHWLSELVFYKLFALVGFTGLILTKTFLVLITFGLLFSRAKKIASFWPILISFFFSIFIFIFRTDVRPEIFSFVILALFLFVLFRAKYNRSGAEGENKSAIHPLENSRANSRGSRVGRMADLLLRDYLWFLPILELLWVNLHIYFFIGPFLVLAFLVDKLCRGSRVGRMADLSKIILIFLLTSAATLINPNGLHGALAPFTILKEYGYSIVENQTLSFLAPFFGFNLPIFIFKLSVGVLITALVLTWKKTKERVFEIIISAFFIYAGFHMVRNLPLYALTSFPILALAFTDIFNFLEQKLAGGTKTLSRVFKISTTVFLILMIFWVAGGHYYKALNSARTFGFSVPNGLERAVEFVKENKIKGPMFNNFDIGGYLIWKLYPQEKVFVDNRPEAYSVKFFSEIYKPMQEDKTKWAEWSKKYGINLVFFGHADATPWGQAFLKSIVKDPVWKIVYLNEDAIVLIKNNPANAEIISRLAISEANAIEKVTAHLRDSNKNKIDLNLMMSRLFYHFNWRQPALYFSEEVIKSDPQNKQAYLNKGLVYAYYTDVENQKLAAENIKQAIDLGLKDSHYYTILGIVYVNLGRLIEAESLFKKALELDENNPQAKAFLEKFFHE